MSDAGVIYAKMLAVQSTIGAVSKSQTNSAKNYKFRGIDSVLQALHPALVEHGVFVTPEVLECTVQQVSVGSKSPFMASLKVAYHFRAEDGSSVTTVVNAGSIDWDDKAELQALSQAYKAAMIQTFSIPTEGTDDADGKSPLKGEGVDNVPARRVQQRPAASEPRLTKHQQEAKDEAANLRGRDVRLAFKTWWTDEQAYPHDDAGLHWHALSESEATVVVGKAVELQAQQSASAQEALV